MLSTKSGYIRPTSNFVVFWEKLQKFIVCVSIPRFLVSIYKFNQEEDIFLCLKLFTSIHQVQTKTKWVLTKPFCQNIFDMMLQKKFYSFYNRINYNFQTLRCTPTYYYEHFLRNYQDVIQKMPTNVQNILRRHFAVNQTDHR